MLAGVGFSEERRVSWRPGADGAPLEVVVVEVEWEDGGTKRRDCGGVSGRGRGWERWCLPCYNADVR